MPLVSVLMSVRNGEATVGRAVDSILSQTLPDLELLITDDGSSDRTSDVLSSIKDRRVRLFRHRTPLGLTRALRSLGSEANSPFLARMDADDTSHPDRLRRQISALKAHPDIGLAGTAFTICNGTKASCTAYSPPVAPADIRWISLFRNPFAHSSVVMRTAEYHAAGGYDPAFGVAQDFDLWERLLRITRGMNLPDHLVALGRSADSVSVLRSDDQELVRAAVSVRAMRQLLRDQDVDETVAASLNSWLDRFPRRLSDADAPGLTLLTSLLKALIDESSGDDLARLEGIATALYVKSRAAAALGSVPTQSTLRRHVTPRAAAEQLLSRAHLVRRRNVAACVSCARSR